jgi:hypothetical protein
MAVAAALKDGDDTVFDRNHHTDNTDAPNGTSGFAHDEKPRDERDRVTPRLLDVIKRNYGLDETAARLTGLMEVSSEESKRLVGWALSGVLIPYFDLNGKPNGKFRIRFYDEELKKFDQLPKDERPQKDMSPRGVAPGIYLYPGLDWASLAVTRDPIYTSEGELGCAKACSMGLPFLAIPGVWAFKSKNARAFELLPDFDEFNLRDREVRIVYDSDIATKPEVLAAQHAYASELAKRGAKPKSIILPTLPGQKKTGIDELLIAQGAHEFKTLLVRDFDEIAQLFKLSSEYVYDRGVHAVLRLSDYSLCYESDFCRDERNRHMLVPGVKGVRDLCAPVEWLKWPNRPDVSALVYDPALPTGRLADGRFNLHRQSVEPKQGDRLHLWHRLVRELVPDEKRRAWLESWLFYPIQNPGVKLYTTVLLWSRMEGSGKSFLGELINRMYGIDGYELNDAERLFEPFNSWAERRRFVLVNEVYSGDGRKRINRLKNLISAETVEINIKHKPHYSIKNTINYLFTSNHEDALYMTDVSRRFEVFHVPELRLDKEFAKELRAWKLGTAGPELLWYAQHYPIVDDFEPFGPAPHTQDNADMIDESGSALDHYCTQIVNTDKATPGTVTTWSYALRDLWTAEEVAYSYNDAHRGTVTSIAAGRSLIKAGAVSLGQVKVNGYPERIVAIRDFETYRRIREQDPPARIAELYFAERSKH